MLSESISIFLKRHYFFFEDFFAVFFTVAFLTAFFTVGFFAFFNAGFFLGAALVFFTTVFFLGAAMACAFLGFAGPRLTIGSSQQIRSIVAQPQSSSRITFNPHTSQPNLRISSRLLTGKVLLLMKIRPLNRFWV